MKAFIEMPLPWLWSPDCTHHERMFMNLLKAVDLLKVPVEMAKVSNRTDEIPRLVEPGQIYFAWHSYGTQRCVWRLKESYLPGWYYFDRCGYSGWAEIANSPALQAESLALPADIAGPKAEAIRHGYISTRASKYVQQEELAFDGDDFVFYPMQVSDDTVMRLARLTPFEIAEGLIAAACKTGRKLVIKRHPFCGNEALAALVRDAAARHPEVISLTQASLHKILPRAREVVVINSGVGVEALLYGKTVHTFGGADYAHLTHRQGVGCDFEAILAGRHQAPSSKSELDSFIAWYFGEYVVNVNDFPAISARVERAMAEASASGIQVGDAPPSPTVHLLIAAQNYELRVAGDKLRAAGDKLRAVNDSLRDEVAALKLSGVEQRHSIDRALIEAQSARDLTAEVERITTDALERARVELTERDARIEGLAASVARHEKISKDPVITFYRKTMRTLGLWKHS